MDWWLQLTLSLQIFYALGIVAGILLAIEAVLTMFGMDHHNAADAASLDHPDGLGFLSLRTITGFFFGFGWSGVVALKSGLGIPAAILVASAVGGVFLFSIYGLMRALFSMRSSGNLNYNNALGCPATVYVTIPAARAGAGQVEILIQGRLTMISSMTTSPVSLAPGTKVKVTEIIDQGTLNVEPLHSIASQ